MLIVSMFIMVCAAFVYVALARRPRKKPNIENQTTKRCPYCDCDWWIVFKDLNDEVRRLYKRHYSEMHKALPKLNFEDVGDYPLAQGQLFLVNKAKKPRS